MRNIHVCVSTQTQTNSQPSLRRRPTNQPLVMLISTPFSSFFRLPDWLHGDTVGTSRPARASRSAPYFEETYQDISTHIADVSGKRNLSRFESRAGYALDNDNDEKKGYFSCLLAKMLCLSEGLVAFHANFRTFYSIFFCLWSYSVVEILKTKIKFPYIQILP
jgi:hypothetical protein